MAATPLWRRVVEPVQMKSWEYLMRSLIGEYDPAWVPIAAALANLVSNSANPRIFMSGLLSFAQDVEAAWFEWDQRCIASLDPVTDRQFFIAQKLALSLDVLSDEKALVIVWRLQNDFGNRVRRLLDCAIDQNSGVVLERLNSAQKILSLIIHLLCKRLNEEPQAYSPGLTNQSWHFPNERVVLELAILSAWGL